MRMMNFIPEDWYYMQTRDMTVFTIRGCKSTAGDEIMIDGSMRKICAVHGNQFAVRGNVFDEHMELKRKRKAS